MPGALDGIRVLDMTIWQQGTSAAAMLADLGADVVKIEDPSGGDPGRGIWRVEKAGGLSGYFQALNRGKRSIALEPLGEDRRAGVVAVVEADGDDLVFHVAGQITVAEEVAHAGGGDSNDIGHVFVGEVLGDHGEHGVGPPLVGGIGHFAGQQAEEVLLHQ